MQTLLDFLNNNQGLVAILGVVVGWLLSSLSERRLYKRQKEDALDKERRDRFSRKAEFSVNESFIVKGDNAKEIHIILCPYTAAIDKDGFVSTTISKDYANKNMLSYDVIYLENVGESDVNELEIATIDPKNAALLDAENARGYIKEGYISYGVMLDRRIQKGEAIELTVYYLKESPINDMISASIEIYYRDSLNNICAQPLFVKDRKTYEPRLIDYSEWHEQVSVNKNLDHWHRRLTGK